jgi:hypothetical protein
MWRQKRRKLREFIHDGHYISVTLEIKSSDEKVRGKMGESKIRQLFRE